MAIGIIPVVGSWYQGVDQLKFEVVALDEDEGIIEIHYLDGEPDEVEFDVWSQLRVEKISPPGDWRGVYDDLERDDLNYTDISLRSETYTFFVEDVERQE